MDNFWNHTMCYKLGEVFKGRVNPQCLFFLFFFFFYPWKHELRERRYSLIKCAGQKGLAGERTSYKEWYAFDLEVIIRYCYSFVFWLSRYGFEWDVVSCLCFPLCVALKLMRSFKYTGFWKHETERHQLTLADLIKALNLVNSIKHFSKASFFNSV